jgi:hypothetical protein
VLSVRAPADRWALLMHYAFVFFCTAFLDKVSTTQCARTQQQLTAVCFLQVLAGCIDESLTYAAIAMQELTCEQVILTPSLSPHSLMKPIITCRTQVPAPKFSRGTTKA